MNLSARRFLIWLPRILSLFFAMFLALFALDVFGGQAGFWRTILALLMHLIPSMLILLILYFSWKRPSVGAISYLVLALFYIVMAWGQFPLITYVTISGPLIIASALFALSGYIENKYAGKSETDPA